MSTLLRLIVAYTCPSKPPDAVGSLQSVVNLMTGNAHFTSAAALLATTANDLTALGKAIASQA